MSLPSVVLSPFAGAYDSLDIGYHGRPVEALSEHVVGCSMVTIDPTMDIAQQTLSLFEGDAVL